MILRSVRFKAGVACLVFLWACQAVAGSTVLLRTAAKTAPELGPVQTYAGKVDPTISPVKPAASVTVVLMMDSLSPAELESVKKDLPTLYMALRAIHCGWRSCETARLELPAPFQAGLS